MILGYGGVSEVELVSPVRLSESGPLIGPYRSFGVTRWEPSDRCVTLTGTHGWRTVLPPITIQADGVAAHITRKYCQQFI